MPSARPAAALTAALTAALLLAACVPPSSPSAASVPGHAPASDASATLPGPTPPAGHASPASPASPVPSSSPTAGPPSRAPIEVAITVDDLPAHGPLPAGLTRLDVHRTLLDAFRKHAVPQVVGFLNADKLTEHPEDRAALEAWVAAGHPLGNHTFRHPNLYEISLADYLQDIDRNEPLLRELMGQAPERAWKLFRYPFLREGRDLPTRNAIRAHLADRGYRIAQVTIDFGDWAWNEPYARCAARNDEEAIKVLDGAFVNYGRATLQWADATARQIYGRPIKQILLLHVGAFDARAIDRLLTAYEKEGVRWISLDDALTDPVYAIDTERTSVWGESLLEQIAEGKGAPHAPYIPLPLGFLRLLCR
ncbi:polysaccharide deacetylase family protein [Chondromyces crocatus]|uniref:NodB homology domain-containing protein n=1 Tax=Chondromyces crocatus TaxID=52 RepID=A0A0K1EIV6_CHOCO|nr:polysaccharide deacetylase family protein [Chondromyces crocatus]AKT40528.1 uncharacterized protein CMC5_046830 [Chondromyces crocatus]